MRQVLFEKDINTDSFCGEFVRYGKTVKMGVEIKTVLLHNITSNGEQLIDHQWFLNQKGFRALNLQPGDYVCFNAELSSYVKGYQGKDKQLRKEHSREWDCQLSSISNALGFRALAPAKEDNESLIHISETWEDYTVKTDRATFKVSVAC